ncbi:hypothetical protein PV10_04610 [Exophiala mesophila]|uniref:Protamine P1 n=1 Tax=Exophiala mesophila TaxID=212818 RepID=A0A0D1ZF74_EXOME|nr:uncharacterized protein PV10_04610 [Exophiala mesophila]KIV93397.1 hypothetical protein PV10_04610 [Exophiala mesophila]
MAITKSRAPEYPRPVPPVSAEEYPICPDTIVYHEASHELDNGVEARAAKRRRIERYAISYLRGEPLFILTAQLRGPFTGDWQSPWSTRGNADVVVDPPKPEIPETSKIVRQRPSSLPHTPLENVQFKDKEEVHSSDHKVERWLKTNKAYGQFSNGHSQSSPTPQTGPVQRRTKKWESPMIDIEFPPVPDEVVNLAQSLPPLPADLPVLDQIHNVLEDDPKVIQTAEAQPDQEPVQRPQTRASLMTDDVRPEFAILASKRRSLHTIPASSHLPAFEFRRVTAREQENGEAPADADADAVNTLPEPTVEDVPEYTNIVPTDTTKPGEELEERQNPPLINTEQSLSKASSCNETEDQLPSAQVIAPLPQQSTISNLSSHGDMLSELHLSNAPVDEVLAGEYRGAEPAKAPGDTRASNMTPALKADEHPRTVIDAAKEVPVKDSDVTPKADIARQFNTQQMVNSITPFAMSTVKKTSYGAGSKSSPAKATKSRTSRNKKRASFALEETVSASSSHASIRMTMKVAKPAKSLNANEKILEDNVVQEISQEGEVDISFSGTRVIRDKGGKEPSSRGILKASMSGSLNDIKSSKQTASSSAKQDAQRVNHFNLGEDEMELNDDAFDVAAAIDDLGSFLGTWDAEMEAAGLR